MLATCTRREVIVGQFLTLAAAVFTAALLSGCAEQPAQPEALVAQRQIASAATVKSFQLSGRIAVKHDGQGFSGALRWAHDPLHDEIFLLSPLGQGVARITRAPSGITLTTADEKTYRADTIEALTQEVLGWRLPLHGLEHWVLGLAAPDSAMRLDLDANGQPARLTQDGWRIDYARYQTVQGVNLPAKLEILRDDDLEVRLVIDRWVLSEDRGQRAEDRGQKTEDRF
ncbi:MAG: lipoprotein insertase outer membrane protein LolB [Sulfuricellaceae bacterium]